jgi:hypothetical protein
MHFLAVWNPLYAVDAMEQHLGVLQRLSEDYAAGRIGDDALYVWWGKVRSGNRQQPLPHLDAIRQLADGPFDDEVHLYLTDYRSLYVGDVRAILVADTLPGAERGHAPAYYDELLCDCWFQLADLRRLVADDLFAVANELAKLRNTGYNDRPVSLYGGIVNLPLLLRREDGARYFDPEDRDAVTGGALWADFDREHGGGVAGMEKELRENRFGEEAWFALEPEVRLFLANAERLWRDHAADPHFDCGPVLTSLGKAMEVQTNLVLRRAAAKLPEAVRRINVDGETVDLARARGLSPGVLARVIPGDRRLMDGLAAALRNGKWFTETLPPVLSQLADLRNPGAHSARITRDEARKVRDRLVGIGCKGEFVELAGCRPK